MVCSVVFLLHDGFVIVGIFAAFLWYMADLVYLQRKYWPRIHS